LDVVRFVAEAVVDEGRFDWGQYFPSAQPNEEMARYTALSLAARIFTAEEYDQLAEDLANRRVEVRIHEDGVCFTRTYT
jgi:hypothetical protein